MSKVLKPGQVAREPVAPGEAAANAPAGSRRPAPAPRPAISEILRHVRAEAERVRAAAERFAQAETERLEAARAEIDRLAVEARAEGYAKGREEGYAAGFAAGREAGLGSLRELLAEFERVVEEARRSRDAMLREAESDLVRLSVAVAEKMLARALREDPTFPASVLSAILADFEPQRSTTLRLAPSTRERWRKVAGEFLAELEGGRGFSVVVDESLEPGDFVLETDWGLVDGRLRKRWGRILEGLDLVEPGDGGDGT